MPTTIPVTLEAGALAPPACYSNEQERFEAYVTAMTAFISGTNLEWVVQSGTPAAGDQGKAWLRIDINGYPIEALFWVTAAGTWVRWFTVPKYPSSSGGVANALTITFNPTVLTRAVGDRFWFIAAATSTGATTLAIDSLAAAPILKSYNTALVANDIKAGQVVEVVWDGTNYQMLSQTANAQVLVANIAPGTVGQVLSTIAGPVTAWKNFYTSTATENANTIVSPKSFVHGGTTAPSVELIWKCNTVDLGFVVGDEVPNELTYLVGASGQKFSCYADATNVYIITAAAVTAAMTRPDTGAHNATPTLASWDLFVRYSF